MQTKTETLYCIGEHFPSVYTPYVKNNRLWDWLTKDEAIEICLQELGQINFALNKYDTPYENEKTMCDGLKQRKICIQKCLEMLETIV